jgi:hypothetical protein
VQVAVTVDRLSEGGAKPPGRAICLGVDRSGPWWTGSLMEKPTFTRTKLSGVRAIMTIMRVPVGELICQTVIGRIPVLKCPLPDVRGCLWLYPVIAGIKYCRFLRTRL